MPKIKVKGQTVQTGEWQTGDKQTRTRMLPNVLLPATRSIKMLFFSSTLS